MTDFEIEEDSVDCVDEEFDEMSREWEDNEDTGDVLNPELYFCNPDPYAKYEKRPDGSPRRNIRFDENGNIIVRNPSAYWIPELTVTEEIDGTIYTVTGRYDGTEALDQKLARIMLHNWDTAAMGKRYLDSRPSSLSTPAAQEAFQVLTLAMMFAATFSSRSIAATISSMESPAYQVLMLALS